MKFVEVQGDLAQLHVSPDSFLAWGLSLKTNSKSPISIVDGAPLLSFLPRVGK